MFENFVMLTVLALPDQLEVPAEFDSIEEAVVVAVAGDEIVVAPGAYASAQPLTWIPGLTIRGSTGTAADVVLSGYFFATAERGGEVKAVTLHECQWESVHVQDCVLESCLASWVSTITGCTGHLEVMGIGSIVNSSLAALTALDAVWLVENSSLIGAGQLELKGEVRHSVIDGLVVTAGESIEAIGSTFRNAPGVALSVGGNAALVVHCTFVNNEVDIASCTLHETELKVYNTIVTTIDGSACETEIGCIGYTLATDGNVDAEGHILRGSAAAGAANFWLGQPAFECPTNIGADQGGSSRRCDFGPGDVTGDGLVDGADLGVLLGAWGKPHPFADFMCPEGVDAADLAVLLAHWLG